jgi:hypothetical protein
MVNYRKLTLHIDGRRITADRFRRAIDAFFEVVTEVTEAVTGQSKAVDWIVSVAPGSINLGVAAEPRKDRVRSVEVVHALYTGFQELSKKAAARPDFFTDTALEKTRELIRIQDGKAVSTIQIRRSNSRVTLNQKVLINVDRILGGTLAEVGTIEGKMEMISARGGLHVGVWDALTDKPVRCNIPPILSDRIIKAFKKRVAVSGTIRYRPTGEAISIDVEDIEVFPEPDKLPTAEAVYGILSKV